jgi:hypothetical protein
MKLRLTPSWELSDERAGSSYVSPVLVNRATGEAFGPGKILEPYAHWGLKPAAVHVVRMSETKKLSGDEMKFVRRFKLLDV